MRELMQWESWGVEVATWVGAWEWEKWFERKVLGRLFYLLNQICYFFLKIRVNSNKLPWSLGLYQQSLELFKSNQIGPSTQFGP